MHYITLNCPEKRFYIITSHNGTNFINFTLDSHLHDVIGQLRCEWKGILTFHSSLDSHERSIKVKISQILTFSIKSKEKIPEYFFWNEILVTHVK